MARKKKTSLLKPMMLMDVIYKNIYQFKLVIKYYVASFSRIWLKIKLLWIIYTFKLSNTFFSKRSGQPSNKSLPCFDIHKSGVIITWRTSQHFSASYLPLTSRCMISLRCKYSNPLRTWCVYLRVNCSVSCPPCLVISSLTLPWNNK